MSEHIIRGQGPESVWEYPRPPRVELTTVPIRVLFNDRVLAETREALRVLETSHPPCYYVPARDVRQEWLQETPRTTYCKWKGHASYYDVKVGDRHAAYAAWAFHEPAQAYAALKDHFAFYAQKMDACYVDGELIQPQPGAFYGGWITGNLAGPFKGGPGTWGW